MATINDYLSSSYYDNSKDYSSINSNSNLFLSGLSVSSDNNSFNLSDYTAIKNGSYGKLLKAYYKKQESEESSKGDNAQKLTLMQTSSDSLSRSVQNLMKESLWEKKTEKRKMKQQEKKKKLWIMTEEQSQKP